MRAVSVEEHMQRMRDIKEKFVSSMQSWGRQAASASLVAPAPTTTLAMETTRVLFTDNEPSEATNHPSAAPPSSDQLGVLHLLAAQGPKVRTLICFTYAKV